MGTPDVDNAQPVEDTPAVVQRVPAGGGGKGGVMASRNVVQLVVHPDYGAVEGFFMAVCDDGTIWERTYKYDREGHGPATNARYEWDQIPGPPEAPHA